MTECRRRALGARFRGSSEGRFDDVQHRFGAHPEGHAGDVEAHFCEATGRLLVPQPPGGQAPQPPLGGVPLTGQKRKVWPRRTESSERRARKWDPGITAAWPKATNSSPPGVNSHL